MAERLPTQLHRFLAIETALGADALMIREFSGEESLGRLFNYSAELLSEKDDIDPDTILGTNATIRMEMASGGDEMVTRYFNGYVNSFAFVGYYDGYAMYRATFVPWLWFSSQRSDCRIFQEKTALDIITEVFDSSGLKNYQVKTTASYRIWEYCVQYRETDFNFVSRLMEQEGMYYYFVHENGKHTLVLADSMSAHDPYPGFEDILYRGSRSGVQHDEYISDWSIRNEVKPGIYAHNDFDFKIPKPHSTTRLLTQTSMEREHTGSSESEIYDYPGEYVKFDEGERYSRVRIEEIHTEFCVANGHTTARGLSTGFKFNLKEHPKADQNDEYLVVSSSFQIQSSGYLSAGASAEDFFVCNFSAIPASAVFRTARVTPKPVVQGPQTAIVVGPSGEEIHTDEFGRIKCQFHWDRRGKADDSSSCWIRVAHGWAGINWGQIFIPRIGHEVVVEFLEGDPDRPLVTGSVYNGVEKPPYKLPDEKTKSTIKTSSTPGGGGYNELRFEDKKGEEQIFIHGEKDLDVRIKHDAKESIGHDKHLNVGHDQFIKVGYTDEEGAPVGGTRNTTIEKDDLLLIKGDHGETIGGSHLEAIGKDDHLEVGGSKYTKVATDDHVDATNIVLNGAANVSVKGGEVAIEGATRLSLKVGGSFIDISPAMISIKAGMVMINSGGSAGSAKSPTPPDPPDAPEDPVVADRADPGDLDPLVVEPSPAARVLQLAAVQGTPFVEICERKPPEPKPKIPVLTKIKWLDGGDTEVSTAEQFVNLPKEAKWVDAGNGPGTDDRLSQIPRFKVTFSEPGAHGFKVKVIPGGENVDYTGAEKGRNPKFEWMEEEMEFTTDGDGTKIVDGDFFTTCAGNDKYQLEAVDVYNNPEQKTGDLTTKRLAYFVRINMRDLPSMITSLGGFTGEYDTKGIKVAELTAVEIDKIENIGSRADENAYKAICETAFDGSEGKAKDPYCVAAGFTDHLAFKNNNVALELTGVEVGPGKDPAEIPVMATGLRASDGMAPRSLWKDLVTGEGWFVSATFTPDGGGAEVDIVEATCAAVPRSASSPSNCRQIDVDVTGLAAGTGTIRLTVHVVDRMRGGLSFGGGNLICVCTRAWWRNRSADRQIQTLIHEMGHKVHMVVTGTGKLPDKVVTHYDDSQGHVGNHCHFGIADQASYQGASGAQCVMFGSSGSTRPANFCENCAPAVRKVDLSDGWPT